MASATQFDDDGRRMLLGVVGIDHLKRLFTVLFDEREFLSPYGLRAISAVHREHPYVLEVEGITATIDYEPAESTTAMFGGNSNWRGPALDAPQLPRRRRARPLLPVLRRRPDHRVPDRQRGGADARQDRRGPAPAPDLALPRRPRRPPPVLRLRRPAPERSRLEGQPRVQRVLPRRQRRRPRRHRTRPAGPGWWPTSSGAVPATASTRSATPLASPRASSRHDQRHDADRGNRFPLGATPTGDGTNFAVASSVADRVELCLFDDDGVESRVALTDYDAGVWHGFVAGVGTGHGLRLPRLRPVRAVAGPAGQPGQAPARPVRPRHQWRRAVGPAIYGHDESDHQRPERPRLGLVGAAQPHRRSGVRRGRTRLGRSAAWPTP